MEAKWGTKQWFESQFNQAQVGTLGDGWGHQWRGSQKFRYSLCLDILKPVLAQNGSMNVLDIGCALGDFTIQAWQLNPKNQFWGIDISANAIARVSLIYPHIQFAVAALPETPFQEGSFDCIICLEVLYYLNSKDRRQAVEDIYRVMCEGGFLLFSGVLDGGVRYFAKDEIIQLISEYFDIQQIRYNYARLYSAFERKLTATRSHLDTFKKVVGMPDTEYKQWLRDKQPSPKLRLVSRFRKFISIIPFGKQITRGCLNLVTKPLTAVLSWKFLPAWFYKITKLILRDKGATHIIILAKKTQC